MSISARHRGRLRRDRRTAPEVYVRGRVVPRGRRADDTELRDSMIPIPSMHGQEGTVQDQGRDPEALVRGGESRTSLSLVKSTAG